MYLLWIIFTFLYSCKNYTSTDSDSSAWKSPVSKNLSYIWLYSFRFFPTSLKLCGNLRKTVTWFSLDRVQQIFLQFHVDAYAVLIPWLVYPHWCIKNTSSVSVSIKSKGIRITLYNKLVRWKRKIHFTFSEN